MTDENVLISRAQNGETGAFRELVEKNKEKIYYLALDLTGNHQDAEDLSQEVFIKAYRFLNRFRGDSKFSSWLYRIAVNTNINQYRKKSFQARKIQESLDNQERDSQKIMDTSNKFHPEESAEAGLMQIHIQQAVNKLSARERSVFVLRHYQNLPIQEIAYNLQVTAGTVKSTLFRAIRKLQNHLSFYREECIQEDQ